MTFTPSKYQQACFDFTTAATGNAVVEAVAGSGKTTTLVQMCKRISPRERVAMVCFNKSVAETLKERVPPHVDAATLHSVGNRAWCQSVGRAEIAGDKTRRIASMLKTDGKIEGWLNAGKIARLVSLAKNEGLVPQTIDGMSGLVPDSDDAWRGLLDHHGMDLGSESDERCYIDAARTALTTSCIYSSKVIDFDDMLYMPALTEGVSFPRYKWVFVDELQDVSALQRVMVQGMAAGGGRFVGVGDPHQAIYGFRGAGVDSMAQVRDTLACRTLPLSISYRCPKAVVALARAGTESLPGVVHIEAAPEAEEGVVEYPQTVTPGDFAPGDMVLCRNKAPLIDFAYALMRSRVRVRILGKEVGQGLVDYVEQVASRSARSTDWRDLPVGAFIDRLRQSTMRAVELATAKDDEDAAERALDRERAILAVIDGTEATTAGDVAREIASMFGDADPSRVLLSTIHKAKGLEADRVHFLDSHLLPSRGARLDWQRQQEANLWYVAVTRARRVLRFIRSGCL